MFNESLRKARKAAGMTQAQIAALMNITKSTYCGYETGKRQPDIEKLKQISSILNIPLDSLMQTGHDATTTPRTQKEAALLELFEKLTPEEQSMLETMAQALIEKRK